MDQVRLCYFDTSRLINVGETPESMCYLTRGHWAGLKIHIKSTCRPDLYIWLLLTTQIEATRLQGAKKDYVKTWHVLP